MHDKQHSRVDRSAISLLALLQENADHRLSESERQARREEVNQTLGALGNEEIDATLTTLYRVAESRARRSAKSSAGNVAESASTGWLSFFRRIWSGSGRRTSA